ncbi:ABC transporter substrate-binding protein [Pseudomonas sp. NPDC088368]|jgi:polar amino acid transport system substrate-binding protein|uniref:ABC transporter substrate-binding protein n=1 Tax=Pseudomonas sp. NPDC088368 TaxID=3364453 RepID=UPI0038281AF3
MNEKDSPFTISRRSALMAGTAMFAAAPLGLMSKAWGATPAFDASYTGFALADIGNDDSLERIQRKGEIVVCTSNDWPYSYLDSKTGAFSGIDADILLLAAKLLKIDKVTVQTVPFDGMVPGVLAGRFDMVGDSIHFSPERAKVVDFSFPTYFYAETMVVKKNSGIRVTTIDQLKDKSCGTLLGTHYSEWIQKAPGVQFKGYKDAEALVQDVASGRLDAGVYDLPVVAGLMKNNPQWPLELVKDYTPRTLKIPSNYSRYIFRQRDQQLINAFSRAIEWIQYSGQMREILQRWGLGEEAN